VPVAEGRVVPGAVGRVVPGAEGRVVPGAEGRVVPYGNCSACQSHSPAWQAPSRPLSH
jgi:hypothetical protein